MASKTVDMAQFANQTDAEDKISFENSEYIDTYIKLKWTIVSDSDEIEALRSSSGGVDLDEMTIKDYINKAAQLEEQLIMNE